MLAEVAGGYLSNSLALLADAGHMLSDVAALGLSLFAMWIAQRPPTPQRTYGYYRLEILAALVNGGALIAMSVGIFVEAAQRVGAPPAVDAALMLGVATGGLGVNLLALWLLSRGRNANLNVRGAWLHVLNDTLGSVGAIAASIGVAAGWGWADPCASILIGVLVLYSSWRLVREAVDVLMEGTPAHIDLDAVRNAMAGVCGVREVHDLHVWTIASGIVALSGHVVAEAGLSHMAVLEQLREALHQRFGIDHITIQVEAADFRERAIPV